MEIKPFNPDSKCPKCGYQLADTLYEETPHHEKDGTMFCKKRMKRTCKRCKAVRYEEPLDRGAGDP